MSLSDEATFAGVAKRRPASEVSLGDERTLGGGDAAGLDTAIDDIEVVDLEARYKIEGTLGQGGMGAVLLATDTRLDRKVAIKRILGEAARSKTAIMRFLTEAKAIAALNHPNIVQIYDYGRAKDGPFLIMEYVDGGSVADRCKQAALPLDETVSLACQICDGLAKAHDAGIVHRDIKPANVLLNRDGHPKLTDFGLAKADAHDHGMTMTGAVMGTPDFMPPEQRRDAAEVDHRSDLWSLAATVYQMATGRSPKIIRFDLLPGELTKVLGKALEEEKDARYQSVREFRDVLRRTLTTAIKPAAEFTAGQCGTCGTVNDVSRKFCSSCGASLRVPCLACGTSVAGWEKICGECGGNQPDLLAARTAELTQQQIDAEKLLEELHFDEAKELLKGFRDLDQRFVAFSSWKEGYEGRLGQARESEERRTGALVAEALQHEAAFDYQAAIHALEKAPPSLRECIADGVEDSPGTILARVTQKQSLVHSLGKFIRQAIADRQLDDLLPKVSQLLELCPHRTDVAKIKKQLEERQNQLARKAATTLQEAKTLLENGQRQQALDLIDRSGLAKARVELAEFRSSLAANHASAVPNDIHGDRLTVLTETVAAAIGEKRFGSARQAIDLFLASVAPDSEPSRRAKELLQECKRKREQAEGRLALLAMFLLFVPVLAGLLFGSLLDGLFGLNGLATGVSVLLGLVVGVPLAYRTGRRAREFKAHVELAELRANTEQGVSGTTNTVWVDQGEALKRQRAHNRLVGTAIFSPLVFALLVGFLGSQKWMPLGLTAALLLSFFVLTPAVIVTCIRRIRKLYR